jgi:hypothetical protein
MGKFWLSFGLAALFLGEPVAAQEAEKSIDMVAIPSEPPIDLDATDLLIRDQLLSECLSTKPNGCVPDVSIDATVEVDVGGCPVGHSCAHGGFTVTRCSPLTVSKGTQQLRAFVQKTLATRGEAILFDDALPEGFLIVSKAKDNPAGTKQFNRVRVDVRGKHDMCVVAVAAHRITVAQHASRSSAWQYSSDDGSTSIVAGIQVIVSQWKAAASQPSLPFGGRGFFPWQ